jgi:hypothetical protein
MPPVDSLYVDRARKIESHVLRRLASVGQARLADELGISESRMSRIKSEGEIERFCSMLAVLGLKVVPESWQCSDPEFMRSLKYFARVGMEHARPETTELDWEET